MSLGEASATDTLGELQGKGDKFTKLSLIEKKRMADLEDAIAYVMKESDKYREMAKKSAIEVMNIHVLTPNPAYQRADGVNIAKEAQIVTAKTLIVMEAKLNKLLSRQSEIQNSNKLMKETINHYRILRKQTDVSHASFEQRLREEKEKIEAYLGESTFILEERERNLKRKEEIEQKNIEEQQQFTLEYEEMGRYVKDQNDALELALLNERKADRASMQKTGRTSDADENPNTANMASDLTVDEELAMAKQVGTLNQFMIQEQNALSDLHKKIATYETMFEQLKNMTGVENLEEMVSGYIAHEEEMFSLYNFIQSMNAEIDVIVEQTARTEADINEFKKDQIDQDYLRKSTLDELQTRLSNMLDITQKADEQNSVHAESVMQISKKVSSLFFKLQCDQMDSKTQNNKGNHHSRGSAGSRPESKIALLTGQGVSDGNVLEYLGCIEQRSVDIISDYLRVLTVSKDPALNVLRLQSIPRSPTPGPPTAASWQGNGGTNVMSQKINLDDLGDEEGLICEGGGANAGEPNNVQGNGNNTNKEKDTDDNKVVDLNAFKNKLQKKLPLKSSTSGTKLGIK